MTSQSKTKIFLLILFTTWLIVNCVVHEPRISNDIIGQLRCAKEGVFLDWKPPLQSWLQLQFFEWTGDDAKSFFIHYFIQLSLYGIGICLIAYYLRRFRPIYVLSSLILLVLNPFFVSLHDVVNDALFIGALLCFIGVYLNTYDKVNRWVRYSGMLLASASLILAVSLRLNGLPVIFTLLFLFACMRGLTLVRSLILSVFLSFSLCGAVHMINYHVINAQKSYPLNFIYTSDMLNVSILRNEWNQHYQTDPIAREFTNKHSPQSIVLAPDNANFFKVPISPYTKKTDEQHSKKLQRAWFTTLKDYPKETTIVRLYSFQLFLFAGRGMWFIDDWIYENYPGTGIFLAENHRNIQLYFTPSFFIYSAQNFLIAILLILAALLYLLKKREWLRDEGVKLAIALGLAGASYLFTFIPLTMSATELRYYLPHSTLFAIALSIFVLYTVDCFVFKKSVKN